MEIKSIKIKTKELLKHKQYEPKKKDDAEFHAMHYLQEIMSDKLMPVTLNKKLISGSNNIETDKEYVTIQDVTELEADQLRAYIRNMVTLAVRLSVGGGSKSDIDKSKELWKRAIDYGNKQTNGKKWDYKG